ncbi:MAG: hypothetical protein RR382_00355 [Tannerellaceae bacterium]
MAEKTEALHPTVKLKVAGEDAVIGDIEFTMFYNQVTSASFSTHRRIDAFESAQNVTGEKVANEVGNMQKAMFEGKPKECVITMNDGLEGERTIKAFTTEPGYSLSSGQVNYRRSMIHRDCLVDALDLSIYAAQPQLPEGKNLVDIDPEEINVRILDILHAGIESWEAQHKKGVQSSTVQDILTQAKHEANKKNLKALELILENSKMGFSELKGEDWLSESMRKNTLNMRIHGVLTQPTGSTFATMLQLADEFQCVYIPGIEGVGKLVNRDLIFEDVKELSLPIVSLHIACGNPGMLPLANIHVVAGLECLPESETMNPALPYAAAWPKKPIEGGAYMRISAPAWSVGMTNFAGSGGAVNPKELMDIDNVIQYMTEERGQDVTKKKEESTNKLLEHWAKSSYRWMSLRSATATVVVPFNINVKEGKFYKVQDINSGSIFSGLLIGITHVVSAQNATGEARTSLTFSHVESGGFQLPFKD